MQEVAAGGRRRLRGGPAGGDEQWLQRLLLRLAPYAAGAWRPNDFAGRRGRGGRQALALYDHPAG